MTKPKSTGNGKSRPSGKEVPTKPPIAEVPPKEDPKEPPKEDQEPPAPTKPPILEDGTPQEPPAPTKPPIPEDDKETARILSKKDRRDRAREVFKTHNVEQIYFTTDGQCFVNPQHARMNADAIKSEEVITVTRKEVK